jgi:uncharacterized membrane protein
MSQLIAIVYPDVHRARSVLETLERLDEAHVVGLADACVVTREDDGKVSLRQLTNQPARGAVGGMLWGSLIGLVFMNPLVGLAAGAAAGAAAGYAIDHGISDRFMRELGEQMAPGSSAVFALLRHATADRLEQELARFGGRVLHTSLSDEAEARLRSVLSGAPHATALPAAASTVSLPFAQT